MEATRPKQEAVLDADYDVEAVRAAFPALQQDLYDDQPLVYLDNAATTQKPQAVIDRLTGYYTRENANVHRGVHFLSQQASDAYEAVRERMADYHRRPRSRRASCARANRLHARDDRGDQPRGRHLGPRGVGGRR